MLEYVYCPELGRLGFVGNAEKLCLFCAYICWVGLVVSFVHA